MFYIESLAACTNYPSDESRIRILGLEEVSSFLVCYVHFSNLLN